MVENFTVPPPAQGSEMEEPVNSLTEEDKDRFFQSVMENKPYFKSYEVFDGRMKITFRTRWTKEIEEVIAKASAESKTVPDFEMLLALSSLSYSLTAINEVPYDIGTLEERQLRLKALQGPKYSLLLSLLRSFDMHVAELQKAGNAPNFWKPAGGTL